MMYWVDNNEYISPKAFINSKNITIPGKSLVERNRHKGKDINILNYSTFIPLVVLFWFFFF